MVGKESGRGLPFFRGMESRQTRRRKKKENNQNLLHAHALIARVMPLDAHNSGFLLLFSCVCVFVLGKHRQKRAETDFLPVSFFFPGIIASPSPPHCPWRVSLPPFRHPPSPPPSRPTSTSCLAWHAWLASPLRQPHTPFLLRPHAPTHKYHPSSFTSSPLALHSHRHSHPQPTNNPEWTTKSLSAARRKAPRQKGTKRKRTRSLWLSRPLRLEENMNWAWKPTRPSKCSIGRTPSGGMDGRRTAQR